jgi:hypothetical protein
MKSKNTKNQAQQKFNVKALKAGDVISFPLFLPELLDIELYYGVITQIRSRSVTVAFALPGAPRRTYMRTPQKKHLVWLAELL